MKTRFFQRAYHLTVLKNYDTIAILTQKPHTRQDILVTQIDILAYSVPAVNTYGDGFYLKLFDAAT